MGVELGPLARLDEDGADPRESLVEDQASWPLLFGRMEAGEPGEGRAGKPRRRHQDPRASVRSRWVVRPRRAVHSRFPESGVCVDKSVRV